MAARPALLWLVAALGFTAGGEAEVAEGSVRLAGGNTDAGRVEIFFQGRWGWICLPPSPPDAPSSGGSRAQGWSVLEAEVVCKQLGLRKGLSTMRMPNGRTDEVLPVLGAECDGTEASLALCRLRARGGGEDADCSEGARLPAGAGVRCTNFVPEEQPQIALEGEALGLDGLLANASRRVACAADPLRAAGAEAEGGAALPVFGCTVHEEVAKEADDVCAGGGGGPGGVEACGALLAIMEPFSAESALDAFVFREPMRAHMRAAHDRHQAAAAAHQGQITPLLQRGLRLAPIGLDLSCVVPNGPRGSCPGARGSEVANVSGVTPGELAAIRGLYLSPIARLLFDLDAPVIGLVGAKAEGTAGAGLEGAARRLYADLENEGVAELGHMSLPQEVLTEALDALGDKVASDKLYSARGKLPSLERWLRENATIQGAVAAYFGGHAMLHGYKAVHLPAQLSEKAFISAHWHNDRAGRRLKMFILLNDVDAMDGHPTQVAKGSHHLAYYWDEEFEQSRYTDAYVQSEFRTQRLAGRAGTGYIFDTNTIHKGTPEGSQHRNVVVVEYHQATKCSVISKMGLNIPCPSGDQIPLNWYFGLGASAGARSAVA